MTKIDWDQVINEHVIPALHWFAEHNLLPVTLRTLFYRLVSLVIIPNTKNSYNKISRYVVKARKDGRIPWKGYISDENRFVVQDFYSHYYVSPDSYIDSEIISKLDQLSTQNYYTSDILYKWYKQKHYVEVWVEKYALAGTFQEFLKDKHVIIVPRRDIRLGALFIRIVKG